MADDITQAENGDIASKDAALAVQQKMGATSNVAPSHSQSDAEQEAVIIEEVITRPRHAAAQALADSSRVAHPAPGAVGAFVAVATPTPLNQPTDLAPKLAQTKPLAAIPVLHAMPQHIEKHKPSEAAPETAKQLPNTPRAPQPPASLPIPPGFTNKFLHLFASRKRPPQPKNPAPPAPPTVPLPPPKPQPPMPAQKTPMPQIPAASQITPPPKTPAPPTPPPPRPIPPAPRSAPMPPRPDIRPIQRPQQPIVPQPPAPPAPAPKPATLPVPNTTERPTPRYPALAGQPPAQKPQLPPQTPRPNGSSLTADIASIMGGIKLPERRDAGVPKRQIEVKQFDTLLGTPPRTREEDAHPTPNTIVMPRTPAVPTNAQNTPSSAPQTEQQLAAVHTLKDDLQHVVRDQKTSLVKAVSLEEDRRVREREAQTIDSDAHAKHAKRVTGIVFGVVLLFVLGAGALLGVYAVERARSMPPPSIVSDTSLLFAENTVAFPIDGQTPNAIKQTLAQARSGTGAALGSITHIVPTIATTNEDGTSGERSATFAEFMQAIGAHPSEDLLRALDSTFFFGVHTVDKNAPLIIVPILSYSRAFAGMLAWERSLNADLAPIFTFVPLQITDASGLPILRPFGDVIMRNHDVRALRDDSGNIVLYYSFPSQKTLVIAESPYTFTEVISRLQAQHKL